MKNLIALAQLGRTVWRTFGWRGLTRRTVHEVRRASGRYQREGHATMHDVSRRSSPEIYYPVGAFDVLPPDTRTRIHDRGRRVVEGEYEAFGHEWRQFPSTAKEWCSSGDGSFTFPTGPWWTVPNLPTGADIKEVWEPGRFGWAYDLIRARQLSDDPAIAETFHRRLEEWTRSAPPFSGVHWSCGQETAIRAIAIMHAEVSLPSSDPADAERITRTLALSAERIEDAIGYGLSQRNNHGISESAALIHLGLRFVGHHTRAASWLERGIRLLDEQIQDQFLADGWYAQHSFYYMRVALEQALLAQYALSGAGLTLAPASLARLGSSFDLIVAVVDEDGGHVPNVGSNDGSLVLPLSSAAYSDFRPLVTLASLVLRRSIPADVPPDPEVLAWIGAELPAPSARRPDGVFRGEQGGWVVVRRGSLSAFLRAGDFHHRPSHLDLMHLHLRVAGRELITDPGTYAYNRPYPWKNGLSVAAVHNGPILDGREPASKGPRFLWRDWPSSRLVTTEWRNGIARVVAEIPDRARREVDFDEDEVTVTDTVLHPEVRTIQVTWLLHPGAPDDIVRVAGGQLLLSSDDAIDAWFSPSYLLRIPTRAIRALRERVGSAPLEIRTSLSVRLPAGSAR